MGFFSEFIDGLSVGYGELTGGLSFEFGALINVFIFAILIAIYAVFTWKFYRYLSKKDLISLNLQKYNTSTHPFARKFFAAVFYLIEYMIILPFLIFFWFAVLALIILVLSAELTAIQVIIVSAAIVTAIRMLSYYEEELAKDLAKIFPFTILAIFIINPSFFSLERVLSNLSEIPGFFGSILLFLLLIIAVEFLLRILDIIVNLFRKEEVTVVVGNRSAVPD